MPENRPSTEVFPPRFHQYSAAFMYPRLPRRFRASCYKKKKGVSHSIILYERYVLITLQNVTPFWFSISKMLSHLTRCKKTQVNCNAAIKLMKMSGEAASQRLVCGSVSLSVFFFFGLPEYCLSPHWYISPIFHIFSQFLFLTFFFFFLLTKCRYIFDSIKRSISKSKGEKNTVDGLSTCPRTSFTGRYIH